jgi:prephenate dehydratase
VKPSPVLFLGPEGTFSHIVAARRYPRNKNLIPCVSFGDIFDQLVAQPGARAVLPVENSLGGTIYDAVDLLIGNAGRVFVREEIALHVRIALIGRKGKPIHRVFSHFVQLHTHREWLAANLPDAELIPVTSTMVAAEQAAKDPLAAALSAPPAAETHKLDILRCPVIRNLHNITHFLVLGDTEQAPLQPEKARSCVAVTFGNTSGSLHRFLGPFARHEVNINRIISRPFREQPDRVVFFMEIDGAPGWKPYDLAIRRAKETCDRFLSFGSYPWQRSIRS